MVIASWAARYAICRVELAVFRGAQLPGAEPERRTSQTAVLKLRCSIRSLRYGVENPGKRAGGYARRGFVGPSMQAGVVHYPVRNEPEGQRSW